MLNTLNTWNGTIEINGRSADSVDLSSMHGKVSIHLYPQGYQPVKQSNTTTEVKDNTIYKVKVRAWMTKESTPDFDFMDKFNKGIPMPLRVMIGTKDKETEKMVHMELHGDVLQEITNYCMCCGKEITNNVSKYFGMGPVCGGHNYVNPFESKEELKQAVHEYRKKLQSMTWTGWIPKSAIEEMKVYLREDEE